jgi:hypothetical protein
MHQTLTGRENSVVQGSDYTFATAIQINNATIIYLLLGYIIVRDHKY